MLRLSWVALLTVAMLAAPGLASPASAAPPVECARKDAQTGICLVEASSPGQGAGNNSNVNTGGGAGGGEPDASPNPCTYAVANPQPWFGHPVWAGQTPGSGTIWVFTCPRPAGLGSGLWTGMVFLPNGAGAPAAPPVDPRAVAQQAIDSMTLRAPEIGLAPPQGSASGLVGLPVWMWVEPGVDTTGPAQASASVGAVTVTAVAQVSRVLWDMGDGNAVTCGVGTPYRPGAETASPDCGHVYAQASSRHAPGGAGPVTATSTWTISWSGGGLSGTQTLELSSSAQLFVGELHVLNQDGGSR